MTENGFFSTKVVLYSRGIKMAPIPEIIRDRNNYKTAIKNKKYTAESV